jgi:hypothetical protein
MLQGKVSVFNRLTDRVFLRDRALHACTVYILSPGRVSHFADTVQYIDLRQ